MIDDKLRVQPELLLVATVGEALVGAVMAGFDGFRGWIYHLAVAPEWRRRGIATQLVRAAEVGLRKLGCPKVNDVFDRAEAAAKRLKMTRSELGISHPSARSVPG